MTFGLSALTDFSVGVFLFGFWKLFLIVGAREPISTTANALATNSHLRYELVAVPEV